MDLVQKEIVSEILKCWVKKTFDQEKNHNVVDFPHPYRPTNLFEVIANVVAESISRLDLIPWNPHHDLLLNIVFLAAAEFRLRNPIVSNKLHLVFLTLFAEEASEYSDDERIPSIPVERPVRLVVLCYYSTHYATCHSS